MTTQPEITVEFDDNGEPIISVNGIKGVSCKDASAFLEKGLGIKTSDTKTKEYYEKIVDKTRQRI
jgi:hypothetical protein